MGITELAEAMVCFLYYIIDIMYRILLFYYIFIILYLLFNADGAVGRCCTRTPRT
jgi:hypothetical protein